jgi:signal transduction histidine kinase
MDRPKRILLALPDAGDRALAALVLRQAFPGSELLCVGDPVGFAEALAGGPASALVTDLSLGWADGLELVRAIRRRDPLTVAVLFSASVSEGLATRGSLPEVDGLVRRSSAGFVELAEVVRGALARVESRRAQPAELDRLDREIVEAAPVGLFSVAPDGTVARANAAFERILRLGVDWRAGGALVHTVFAGVAPAVPWPALLEGKEAIREPDLRLHRPGEEPLWLCLEVWPVQDGRGGVRRLDGALQDVGRYRRAAVAAPEPPPSAGDSRAELEQLTYAVSHDLQEPLHVIARNAQLLFERHGKRLDPEGERFLGHLRNSAARMQEMLDGLLACARAGRDTHPLEPVDFGAALAEALENLRASIEEGKGEVRHGPLPTLPADYRQIVQLFQNLVGNAVKFAGPEPVRVVVGARERERDWRFAIKDNGVGIDPRFHARIFGMFQRLHTAEEYPGTGVGLALCKRIVERHGGEIWVHSAPGEGSTFFFTIPKQRAVVVGEVAD